jgi:predicted RNA-binding protein (TIGR00451 family)
MNSDLKKIRAIADYQFGYGAGVIIFPDDTKIEYSKKTGRPRHFFKDEILLANYRPNNALLTLTMAGAIRLVKDLKHFEYKVTVSNEVADIISQGKNVMAKHVIKANSAIRPGNEVIIVDQCNETIAVGKSILTGEEMLYFKTGIAVRVRRGKDKNR